MRPVVIGTESDARGFGLAGVETHVCATRDDVEKTLDKVLLTTSDPLLIFSENAAQMIAARRDKWRRDGTGPLFVTLSSEPCEPLAASTR